MKKFFYVFVSLFFLMHAQNSWAIDPVLKKASDFTYNAHFSEAEALLNDYIAANPLDPWGYILRGTNTDWKQKIQNLHGKLDNQVLDDYKIANDHAFQQWDRDQDNIDKKITLGNSYLYVSKKWLDMGRKTRAGLILKKCQRHMDEAIKQDPNRFDAYLAVGLFNFYAANLPSGLQFFASLLGISGNETKGLNMMNKAATEPNVLQNDALFMLSYAYGHTKQNYPLSQNYLRQLIMRYPDNSYFMMVRGENSFKMGAYEQTRKDMGTLLNFCNAKPDSCAPAQIFLANFDSAASYIQQNNILAAVPFVEKAVALNDNSSSDKAVALHLYQGLIFRAKGKKQEALAEFEKVEDGREKNPSAWDRAQKEQQLLEQ